MATQIQNVIAARTLQRTRADGTTSDVETYIGDLTYIPAEAPDLSEYWTAWAEVTGVDTSSDYCKVSGSDSVQAVFHALARVGMILSGAVCVGEIEDRGPNFGFPPLPSVPPDPCPDC